MSSIAYVNVGFGCWSRVPAIQGLNLSAVVMQTNGLVRGVGTAPTLLQKLTWFSCKLEDSLDVLFVSLVLVFPKLQLNTVLAQAQ